jgi:SAM-dependent methyltransferase
MPQANYILHYASYKSLETISLGSQLFSFANKETLNKLFVQQILNPKLERFISSKILICAYDDATRSNVLKGFYHEYPYPQWSYLLNRHKFESAKDYITSKIGYEIDSFNPDKASRILIAGSGTGIHAIDVASKLPSCEIFAIDISLNSLAFAKRKAIEMQIENISFLCADLRDAHLWKEQFDFIECAGVLHHLESPAEGLFSLRACLKKNGMLLLGLYSANGRRDLAILKEMFPQHEDEEPASYCRRIRSIVMEDVRFSTILKRVDFYSLNGCEDLFMNPVERNYDLTEISRIMADFNLTLRGFELNNWQRTFLSHYEPESLASWSFEDWAKIEDSERDFFAGMYQFWVQKA